MKQLLNHAVIVLLLSSLLAACSKGSSGSVAPQKTDVYVFGQNGFSSNQGGYWKDGVFTSIDGAVGTVYGYVSGKDIYAAGQNGQYSGYWKNGVFTKLDSSNIGNPSNPTWANAVSVVVSNNDVYVLGTETGAGTTAIPSYVFKYWKNGVVNTNTAKGVAVNNMVVSGNDVYVSGNLYPSSSNVNILVPKYWKNGVETILAAAGDQASASQIFVSGNDVYVAGKKGKYAGYWKNGLFTPLTDGSQYGYAQAIYVSGKDVYVAGSDGNTVEYWKNGAVAATLGDASTGEFYLTSMCVSGSDVYILGAEDLYALLYWKNGVPTYLTDGSTTYGEPGSIVVATN